MDFYASISDYYDLIFPEDPATVRFLAQRAPEGGRVLDVACGTGTHALALARAGRTVTGVDLDRAMIEHARRKSGSLPVRFLVGDMQRLRKEVEGPFELVYCVGNSIVHLSDDGAIRRALEEFCLLLLPGGTVVVQILNYDRILARGLTELPTIEPREGGLRFIRRYSFRPGEEAVSFHTELLVNGAGGQRRIVNEVPLRILKAEALQELARQAGFRELRLYGSFTGGPLTPESFPLILEGRRS